MRTLPGCFISNVADFILFFIVLEIDPGASCIQDKHSISEPSPWAGVAVFT